jgi:hypothetical protein
MCVSATHGMSRPPALPPWLLHVGSVIWFVSWLNPIEVEALEEGHLHS